MSEFALQTLRGALYSPICDTSESAYQIYLETVKRFEITASRQDGQFVEQFKLVHGTGCVAGCHGGIDNIGGGFGCQSYGAISPEINQSNGFVGGIGVSVDKHGAVNSGIESAQQGRQRVGWLASGDVGKDCGDVRGGVHDVANAGGVSDTKNWNGYVGSLDKDGSRGKNWDRNQAWKKEKKDKKLRRKTRDLASASKNWRADRIVSQRPGYFSECPEDVQAALRETRAEYLIAKNKKDAVLAKKKLEDLSSDVQIVSETLKFMRLAEQVEKNSSRVKMGGWAKTLVSSVSDSFVNSAASRSSSVPSLESLEMGESASQSGGSDSLSKMRLLEYDMAVRSVEKRFENLEAYDEAEYVRAMSLLKDAYADVVLTGEERIQKASMLKLSEKLATMGVSPMKLNDALIGFGVLEEAECY